MRRITSLVTAASVLLLATATIADHLVVPGISIKQLDEADFHTLFPSGPICALGVLLLPGFELSNPDDTLYTDGDTVARIQSAVYEGTGAAAGLFAYAYQSDCTGGNVAPYTVEFPLAGATLHATSGGLSTEPLTYISTHFNSPVPFEPLPRTLFTGNLGNFNLSEFGGSYGIGGDTAAGWTDARQVGDLVEGISTTDNFWSSSILLFVTDRPPVVSHATVTAGIAAGQPNTVAACLPQPGVGPAPGLPPGDIIVEPTDEIGEVTSVKVDIKPGSDPNALNTKRRGQLPIGIYGSATFDVREIDLSTLMVECMGSTSVGIRFAFEDLVVEDGFLDLILHVPVESFPWGAPRGALVTLTVSGLLYDGTPFVGEDVVMVVK